MYNSITVVGHLGRDPEIKTSEKGHKFGTFSAATSRTTKDKQGVFSKETTWHEVVVLDPYLTERLAQFKKGHLILVNGSQEYREYTDKQGNKKKAGVIYVRSGGKMIKMDKAEEKSQEPVPSYSDDMPF